MTDKYHKCPTPKFVDRGRQCIWINSRGIRCKKKAKFVFFCSDHLRVVGKVESCSCNVADVGITG